MTGWLGIGPTKRKKQPPEVTGLLAFVPCKENGRAAGPAPIGSGKYPTALPPPQKGPQPFEGRQGEPQYSAGKQAGKQAERQQGR